MGERPSVPDPGNTGDVAATGQRTYRNAASAWVEAPVQLRELGDVIEEPVEHKRRIGGFLLWRARPPVGEFRYVAIADDLSASFRFDLHGRTGRGHGADGRLHLRAWKERLREAS
jgi:hypothetical protein